MQLPGTDLTPRYASSGGSATSGTTGATIVLDTTTRALLLQQGVSLTPAGSALVFNSAGFTPDQLVNAYIAGDVDLTTLEILGVPAPAGVASITRKAFTITSPLFTAVASNNTAPIVTTNGTTLPTVNVPKGRSLRAYVSTPLGGKTGSESGNDAPLLVVGMNAQPGTANTDGSIPWTLVPVWNQLINVSTAYGLRAAADYNATVTVEMFDAKNP